MNVVILIGRLTKDPELKQTSSNLVYCRFTIAVDRPFSKDNATDFINCVAWRKQAENLCKYQKKRQFNRRDGKHTGKQLQG